jgi:hypothetical protein
MSKDRYGTGQPINHNRGFDHGTAGVVLRKRFLQPARHAVAEATLAEHEARPRMQECPDCGHVYKRPGLADGRAGPVVGQRAARAALMGYDAVVHETNGYVLVLNRGALLVQDEPISDVIRVEPEYRSVAQRAQVRNERGEFASAGPRLPINEEFVLQRHDAAERSAAMWGGRRGMSAAEYRTQAEAVLKTMLAGSEIRMRVPSNVLDDIFESGHVKNQFETNTSGGVLAPELRRLWERQLFGIPKEADAAERPVYGYIASKDAPTGENDSDGVAMYGDAILRLKDGARQRATVVFGDSVQAEQAVSRMDDPKLESTNTFDEFPGLSSFAERWDPMTWKKSWDAPMYIEAQVHGGVQASDIEEVVLTLTNPTAERYLADHGIPYRYSTIRENTWSAGKYADQ